MATVPKSPLRAITAAEQTILAPITRARALLAVAAGQSFATAAQRIISRRALAGQHPQTPEAIIAWLEETVAGWNAAPTPFVWGGTRHARRERARQRQIGGSAACLPEHQVFAA